MKRWISMLLAMLVMLMVFPAAAFAGEAEDAPAYGGTVQLYASNFYNYWDAAIQDVGYTYWFESLFTFDWSINDVEVAPFDSTSIRYTQMMGQIAESWDDLETFIANGYFDVKIREDIYFQEKDPEYDIFGARNLTAEDVAFSYNRLLGAGGLEKVVCETNWANQLNMLNPELAAEAIDTYTVRFYFNQATEAQLDNFFSRMINITGPEWGELTEEQQSDWHYVCGTGPYLLTEYVADNYMVLTRNPNYYDHDERFPENQLPYIDEVVFTVYKDNATIATQFIAGNLDFFNNGSISMSDSELQQIRDLADYTEYEFATSNGWGISFKCTQDPWNNINVRKALQLAIDLDAINYSYFGYTEEPVVPAMFSCANTDWLSFYEWDEELRAEYSYDPDEANRILDEEGYPMDANGIRFSMNVLAQTDVDTVLMTLIQSYLAAVGVDMQFEVALDNTASIACESDPDVEQLATSQAGQIVDPGMAMVFLIPGGGRYSIHDYDSAESLAFQEKFQELLGATYLKDQAELCRECDEMFARAHWQLMLTPFRCSSQFYSTRLHGHSGEILMGWSNYPRTMMSRMWLVEE